MAIFQKTTPRKDTVTKRPLTADDIVFLHDLQHELNTQDTMCNADPRFWVIKESVGIPATEDDYDERHLVYKGEAVETLEELCDIINDMPNYYSACMVDHALTLYEVLPGEDEEYVGTWKRMDSLFDYLDLDDPEGPWAEFSFAYTKNGSHIVPDTLFLTHRECEDHLRKYGYNYGKDAHAYAMTAVRSPQFERLIKLLQRVDFDALLKKGE